MSQFTLFDLDAIPIVEPVPAPVNKTRWYVCYVKDDGEYALTDSNSNHSTWSKIGTFKHQPYLFKTYAGAKRRGIDTYGWDSCVVKEWKGW